VVKEQRTLMVAYEKSETKWRVCCVCPRWRTFKGSIFTDDDEPELMYNYEKSFGIPFLCLWRPEIRVYDHEEVLLGRIKNVFNWCKMVMQICDINEDPIYEVSASKITAGFMWESICSTCSPINFDIKDLRRDGTVVSKIVKHTMGCGVEMTNNADKYYLDFSSVMSYEERVCLTVAVHEIDMLWFERKIPCIC